MRGIYECRCDERRQTKTQKFTRLPYTGLVLELEHLKIETRLISERFANKLVGKFICSRIKKRREPRVTVVTLKLCGDKKSLYLREA